jgi:hypothetical protein
MAYTRERLKHTISVFQEAKLKELTTRSNSALQRHHREEFSFRRVSAPTTTGQSVGWHDDLSSADEYDPADEGGGKRRASWRTGIGPSPHFVKRIKRATTEDDGEVYDLCPSNAFVTLKLNSGPGKIRLRELAETHGSGYPNYTGDSSGQPGHLDSSSSTSPEPGNVWPTYEQKLDAEAAMIDNSDGRVLRSRKVPDHNEHAQRAKCIACKEANKRCSLTQNGTPPCNRCLQLAIGCLDSTKAVERHPAAVPAEAQSPSQIVKAHVPAMRQSPERPQNPALPKVPAAVSAEAKSPGQIIKVEVPMMRPSSECTKPGPGASVNDPILLDTPPGSPTPAATTSLVLVDTNWKHPIDFKYVGKNPDYPCHFCTDFRYGIFGCVGKVSSDAQRTAKPDLSSHAQQATTIPAQGVTRMCVNCSLNRLYISRCRNHQLRGFGTRSKDKLYEYNTQLLYTSRDRSIRNGVYPTCSVCPQAAFWRCCSDQRRDKYARVLTSEAGKGRGCGLLLCDKCHNKVEADMGRLRPRSLDRTPGFTPRADAEFLLPGSILHQVYGV